MRRGGKVQGFGRKELDIADHEALAAVFERERPSVVINAAAYTDVDRAEIEPDLAWRVNAEGPRILAGLAARCGTLLVHISTDYVFDGSKRQPYIEDDPTSPLNVYGKTKLAGEEALKASDARFVIVRTARLFAPWGESFVSKVLRQARSGEKLCIAEDLGGSPTYAVDLAETILQLVGWAQERLDVREVLHVVNSGTASWLELTQETVRLAGFDVPVVRSSGPAGGAPRPVYSVLSSAKLERIIGKPLRSWRKALAECVKQMKPAP